MRPDALRSLGALGSSTSARFADACGMESQRLDIVEGDGEAWPLVPKGSNTPDAKGRPFLMVRFACANAYHKVFRSLDQTHYLARCPKCGLTKRFEVGHQGTGERTFTLSCR